MAILEKVMQLKKEGRNEAEIIAQLRGQGVSPLEISEALNQSKIKEAVTDPNPTQGMTPSIMQLGDDPAPKIEKETTPEEEVPQEEIYTPQQQAAPITQAPAPAPNQPQAPQSMQQYQPQPYAPQEQYYDQYSQGQTYQPQPEDPFAGYDQPQQDYYTGGGYDDYSQGTGGYTGSTDAMIEVAEQVFSEKMKKMQKELRAFSEFKTIFETKVENLSNRLERMEKHFDRMQLDILGKVSEYGKGLDYMRKELNMVQDSFGKMTSKF